MNTIVEGIKKLSISERIQLVADVWDSIAAEAPCSLNLSVQEQQELQRRYAAHQVNPSSGIPWEHVRAKLFSRIKG